nr:twin-arginine translocation signal domain-containing protein [Micromonospora sp. DSM 115978]
MDVSSLGGADSGAELVLRTAAGDSGDNSTIPVERRGFLRLVAAAGGVAVVPAVVSGEPWERLSAALRQQTPVTPSLVDELARRTAGLYGLEERVPARALMGRVTAHLDTISQLLESGGRA